MGDSFCRINFSYSYSKAVKESTKVPKSKQRVEEQLKFVEDLVNSLEDQIGLIDQVDILHDSTPSKIRYNLLVPLLSVVMSALTKLSV